MQPRAKFKTSVHFTSTAYRGGVRSPCGRPHVRRAASFISFLGLDFKNLT